MVKRTRSKLFGGQEMAQESWHSPLCDNQRLVIVQDYCLVALPTKTLNLLLLWQLRCGGGF